MISKKLSTQGVSIVELLVGALISTFVIAAFSLLYSNFIKSRNFSIAQTDSQSNVTELAMHILTHGRLATSCDKTASSTLECSVDLNVPPTGQLTKLRYVLLGTSVELQKQNGSSWEVQKIFSDIENFEICADGDMTAGTCTILPLSISSTHKNNLTGTVPTPPKRFFRFSIQRKAIKITDANKESQQGSFFVRNPAANAITYQWGS